jgi:hypothetical protein
MGNAEDMTAQASQMLRGSGFHYWNRMEMIRQHPSGSFASRGLAIPEPSFGDEQFHWKVLVELQLSTKT